ncbi:MAG TPA: glycosyltransferase [Chitinophagaceae bacterium]|nr:glycosyltransferase [Chitinophagaceae bacterium]
MISICIPVYNYNVVSLVHELSNQLEVLSVGGEILVFDDCSEEAYRLQNSSLKDIASVEYKELGQNVGRIGIRSLLAGAARYPWLLYIDSDSGVVNKSFLLNYYKTIDERSNVITGGRLYTPKHPALCTKRLHWKYGTEREAKRGSRIALHTNNFLVKKEVFQELHFPTYLKGYGHEDTWMQMEFEKKGIGITHIHNPVIHVGLEEAKTFLEKSDHASKNLLLLASYENKALLRKYSPLYNAFHLLSRSRSTKVFFFLFRLVKNRVLHNLNSCTPSLFYLDIWKLYRMVSLSNQYPV